MAASTAGTVVVRRSLKGEDSIENETPKLETPEVPRSGLSLGARTCEPARATGSYRAARAGDRPTHTCADCFGRSPSQATDENRWTAAASEGRPTCQLKSFFRVRAARCRMSAGVPKLPRPAHPAHSFERFVAAAPVPSLPPGYSKHNPKIPFGNASSALLCPCPIRVSSIQN